MGFDKFFPSLGPSAFLLEAKWGPVGAKASTSSETQQRVACGSSPEVQQRGSARVREGLVIPSKLRQPSQPSQASISHLAPSLAASQQRDPMPHDAHARYLLT